MSDNPNYPEAEIICVGYELLNGKTLNTNARWLGSQLTTLGFRVRRCTIVGDELAEISTAIKESLSRKASVLLLTGGLGPTFDDKTLEGVSKALSTRLSLNIHALKMVAAKYKIAEASFGRIPLTEARVKMARLPLGAKPLANPVGTAPGVEIARNKTRIYCLPGVPDEMTSIFNNSVRRVLSNTGVKAAHFESRFKAFDIMESTLAPITNKIMKKYGVYVKSHPHSSEFDKPWLEIDVTLDESQEEEGEKILKEAFRELVKEIKGAGGLIRTITR